LNSLNFFKLDVKSRSIERGDGVLRPLLSKSQFENLYIRGDVMNKLELIDMLKNECRLSKKEAAAVVDLFFDSMSEALAKGDRVEIRGLCSFYVKEYRSYRGRNPKTGESVWVAPKKLPFFKSGKELKERVDS
jgi:integration host factor subunit beta